MTESGALCQLSCVTAVAESVALSGGSRGSREGQSFALLRTVPLLLPSGCPVSLSVYLMPIVLGTWEGLEHAEAGTPHLHLWACGRVASHLVRFYIYFIYQV